MIRIRNKPVFKCNPFLVGAALQTGGALASSLTSGLLGQNAQKAANRTNLQIARENNQLSLDMFNRQLQYNSFENQRKMLEEAGYSPYSLFGTSSVSAPNAPALQQAQVMPENALATSIGNATGNLAQIMSVFADAKLKNAQAESQIIQNEVLPDLLEIQRQGGISDVVWKDIRNKLQRHQFDAFAIQPTIDNMFKFQQYKLTAEQTALIAIEVGLQQKYGEKLKLQELETMAARAFADFQKGWLDQGELAHIDDKYKALLKQADAAMKQAEAAEKQANTAAYRAPYQNMKDYYDSKYSNAQGDYTKELQRGEELLNDYKYENYDRYFGLGLDKIEVEIQKIKADKNVSVKQKRYLMALFEKAEADAQKARDDHAYRLVHELRESAKIYFEGVSSGVGVVKSFFGK